jgi:hypothetical protein
LHNTYRQRRDCQQDHVNNPDADASSRGFASASRVAERDAPEDDR